MTSFASEELAASRVFADLLAILIVVAYHGKELKCGLPLARALQFIFVRIHSFRYDG
jgi:hypothetical protein